jgi:predicted transcriptional regulator
MPQPDDITLQNRRAIAYVHSMPQPAPVADHVETKAERKARLAWEATGIAEADAELDAGLYVDAAELRAWIDSLHTDSPLPPPPTRRS